MTLKELLKPPFHHDGTSTGMVYDGNTRLLDIRGWGFFQNYENGEQLQDEFKKFVVQALNEKWNREKPHDPEEPVDCMTCTGLEEMEDCDPGHYRCKHRGVDGIDPYVKEPCSVYKKIGGGK
jgi:hypothetical protein